MPEITQSMHQLAEPLWQESFNHPFIKELAAGNLPTDTFRYYLKQDRYYLQNFGDLHKQIADHISSPKIKEFLYAGAEGLHDDEADVRKTFFQELAITPAEIEATPIAPNAYSYVSHMYHELHEGSPARAAAALLPCYWLYNEIGKKLIKNGSPVKIYQQFIDTYDSDGFTDATNEMIKIVDELGAAANSDEQKGMKTAFVRSSWFELHFWGMAYEHQQWA
ncbi:thiaminase II [Lentilactobacillus diolivorans]|uniref:Aminopyrimidine aminohydrolase n=2 Tax=Lentilactobacillus diolivorans TaxID=179838 RepID=A0A0R1SNX9_9LACO|nr:thiaminase II [Lentilactobacillus diolivorans]KRL68005.1 thiaminase [Lentilactobacillus diolivorans DSM 14421]GEP24819.1 aminopyrimidine aminohydrolase [Lentilactobacillus diolivorans]